MSCPISFISIEPFKKMLIDILSMCIIVFALNFTLALILKMMRYFNTCHDCNVTLMFRRLNLIFKRNINLALTFPSSYSSVQMEMMQQDTVKTLDFTSQACTAGKLMRR